MISPHLFVLVLGVLLSTSIVGVIGNLMNDILDAHDDFRRVSYAGYIFVTTIGLAPDYGHPIIIGLTAFVGVVIVGKRGAKWLLKPHTTPWTDDESGR